MTEAFTYKTEAEICGVDCAVELEIEAAWEDSGIGSYEHFGTRGTHHSWAWEFIRLISARITSDLRQNVSDYLAETTDTATLDEKLAQVTSVIEKANKEGSTDGIIDNDDVYGFLSRQEQP